MTLKHVFLLFTTFHMINTCYIFTSYWLFYCMFVGRNEQKSKSALRVRLCYFSFFYIKKKVTQVFVKWTILLYSTAWPKWYNIHNEYLEEKHKSFVVLNIEGPILTLTCVMRYDSVYRYASFPQKQRHKSTLTPLTRYVFLGRGWMWPSVPLSKT